MTCCRAFDDASRTDPPSDMSSGSRVRLVRIGYGLTLLASLVAFAARAGGQSVSHASATSHAASPGISSARGR